MDFLPFISYLVKQASLWLRTFCISHFFIFQLVPRPWFLLKSLPNCQWDMLLVVCKMERKCKIFHCENANCTFTTQNTFAFFHTCCQTLVSVTKWYKIAKQRINYQNGLKTLYFKQCLMHLKYFHDIVRARTILNLSTAPSSWFGVGDFRLFASHVFFSPEFCCYYYFVMNFAHAQLFVVAFCWKTVESTIVILRWRSCGFLAHFSRKISIWGSPLKKKLLQVMNFRKWDRVRFAGSGLELSQDSIDRSHQMTIRQGEF